MSGEKNLEVLLKTMSPKLNDGEYVFITLSGSYGDYQNLNPIGTFVEKEGLTLIIKKEMALSEKLTFEGVFRMITLEVHSSLDAVGLTAAVATKLKNFGISANVIAAYYHDHFFVQTEKAQAALECLKTFSE